MTSTVAQHASSLNMDEGAGFYRRWPPSIAPSRHGNAVHSPGAAMEQTLTAVTRTRAPRFPHHPVPAPAPVVVIKECPGLCLFPSLMSRPRAPLSGPSPSVNDPFIHRLCVRSQELVMPGPVRFSAEDPSGWVLIHFFWKDLTTAPRSS